MIPTADRRVGGEASRLVLSTYLGPFTYLEVGSRGEQIARHPGVPFYPIRFVKYGRYLYVLGTYPSRFDGSHFTALSLSPMTVVASGGNVVGDRLILCGPDFLRVYNAGTGKQVASYRDYALLSYFSPYGSGYVGSSYSMVVRSDSYFNPVELFPVKGRVVYHAVYDGSYYYALEDLMWVRKYTPEGRMVAERFLYFTIWLDLEPEGLYVVYNDGVARLGGDLDVVDKIPLGIAGRTAVLGGYLYVSGEDRVMYKLDKSTKSVVATYRTAYVFNSLKTTDDGYLIAVVSDASNNTYIKIFDANMNEVSSYSASDIPYVAYAYDASKVPGRNEIAVSAPPLGIDFVFDMASKQVTYAYANFFPWDADFNGSYYALALPVRGVVRVLDSNMKLVKEVALASPTSLRFHGGRLYVADNYANAVYVLDDSFNAVTVYDLSGLFNDYPVWTVGRWSGGWYAINTFSKLAFFDEEFRPIKVIPISQIGDLIADFTEFQGGLYLLGNNTSTIYRIAWDGRVLARYTAGYDYLDRASPSPTGGLHVYKSTRPIRLFRDMQYEKVIAFYTNKYYRTPSGTYIAATHTYGPTGVIREYDRDGNLVRELRLSGVIPFHVAPLSDGALAVADTVSMEVRKYTWGGARLWSVKCAGSPYIAPKWSFRGVWLYGYGYVKSIDLDGNVSDFVVEEGTMFNSVFEDRHYVYVLELHPKARVRKYTKDGRYLEDVYVVEDVGGPVWLAGDVADLSQPLHVLRQFR